MASMFSTLLSGSHPGSWKIPGTNIALPDFGFTEQAAQALGRPTTYQGGSNLFGPQPQANTGSTLGTQNQYQPPQSPVNPPYSPTLSGTNPTNNNAGSQQIQGLPQQVPQQDNGINDWQNQAGGAASNQAKAELEAAMNEYSRQEELGNQQIGQYQQEEASTLSDINTMRGRVGTEATTAKTDAESATLKEKGKALSTAQDTQRTNRNILRALGILSSSAAGEMLTKPMTQYGQVSGELGTQLVKRKQQVDQWLMERNQDFDSQVTQIQNQYRGLVDRIRTDLRYNGEQRATAVKAASAALQQMMADIQQTAMQYQQAAREYNNNILGQIAQIQLYQNPQADVSSILSTMLNPGAQRPQGSTAAIYEDPRKRNQTLSGLS